MHSGALEVDSLEKPQHTQRMKENINYRGADWNLITQILEDEIKGLRERNDSPALSAEQTAMIRGEIAALKKILWWPEQIRLERQALPSVESD